MIQSAGRTCRSISPGPGPTTNFLVMGVCNPDCFPDRVFHIPFPQKKRESCNNSLRAVRSLNLCSYIRRQLTRCLRSVRSAVVSVNIAATVLINHIAEKTGFFGLDVIRPGSTYLNSVYFLQTINFYMKKKLDSTEQ